VLIVVVVVFVVDGVGFCCFFLLNNPLLRYGGVGFGAFSPIM